MGEIAGLVGTVVAVVSLVVAVLAFRRSSDAQREANAVQRRLLAIEEQREKDRLATPSRAELRAELRQTPGATCRLYVINQGLAEAQNVTVSLDGKALPEHEAAGGDNLGSIIGPKSEVSCILFIYSECAPPFKIKIVWDDASGKDRTYHSTLT